MMEYYLVIYKVILDDSDSYYGKVGIASKNFDCDWEIAKVSIYKGYRTSFPHARRIDIEPVKATKVSMRKYAAFVSIARNSYN